MKTLFTGINKDTGMNDIIVKIKYKKDIDDCIPHMIYFVYKLKTVNVLKIDAMALS